MKAIVADDHPMVREAIADTLRCRYGESTQVIGVGTYDGLLVALEMGAVDLVVTDLDMPDLSPFHNLANVLRKAGRTPILVFSSSDSPAVVRSVMCQGARGYVSKSEARERLLQGIEAVLEGETFVDAGLVEGAVADLQALPAPSPWRSGALRDGHKPARRPAPPHLRLTPRQRDILRCVGQGLSNKQIARRLGISDSTVKVHMHGLFERLGVENRTQAALAATQERDEDDREPMDSRYPLPARSAS